MSKRNNNRKRPKDVAKSRAVIAVLKESKRKQKKDVHAIESKKMMKLKRLPSFRTISKKMSKGSEFLLDLLKATTFKRGLVQYYSDNKWKDRWMRYLNA